MGKIRVKVDVVIPPPVNVSVRIENEDTGEVVYDNEHAPPFEIAVEVEPGNYIVTVAGMNQQYETTTISVGGDFTPPDTRETTKLDYCETFFGSVYL